MKRSTARRSIALDRGSSSPSAIVSRQTGAAAAKSRYIAKKIASLTTSALMRSGLAARASRIRRNPAAISPRSRSICPRHSSAHGSAGVCRRAVSIFSSSGAAWWKTSSESTPCEMISPRYANRLPGTTPLRAGERPTMLPSPSAISTTSGASVGRKSRLAVTTPQPLGLARPRSTGLSQARLPSASDRASTPSRPTTITRPSTTPAT